MLFRDPGQGATKSDRILASFLSVFSSALTIKGGLIVVNEILFKKAQNGDVEAFETLIRGYEKLIYNAAYRMLGDAGDAEDASQEVILKVYRNLSACKASTAFKSWLFRIINNTCIDELRKKKGKSTLSLDVRLDDSDSRMEDFVLKDETTPESEFLRKDLSKNIQKAIDKLPPDYKAIIVMRDINELSYDEITEALGINIGTVKSRIARGRKRLRDELLESGISLHQEQT